MSLCRKKLRVIIFMFGGIFVKKFISALIIILLLLPVLNPSPVYANQVVNDFLTAYDLPPDTTRDEFLDHIIQNATIKPWEDELGADATRVEIHYYLYSNAIFPEDLGIDVGEDFSDWNVTFYAPFPDMEELPTFGDYLKYEIEEKGVEGVFPETISGLRDKTTAESLLGMAIEFGIQATAVKFLGHQLPLPVGTGDFIATPVLILFAEPLSEPDPEPEPEPEPEPAPDPDICIVEDCDRGKFLDSEYCMRHRREFDEPSQDTDREPSRDTDREVPRDTDQEPELDTVREPPGDTGVACSNPSCDCGGRGVGCSGFFPANGY